jgi:hypothetical protein
MEKALEFLLENFKDLDHSGKSYIEHSTNVFNLLKKIGADQNVCLAGLYHSIYGTDSFSQQVLVTRETIKLLIGEYSENLVFIFSTAKNKDLEFLKIPTTQIEEELLLISYANLKEQQPRINDPLLNDLILKYEDIIFNIQPDPTELLKINNKELIVLDNVFESHEIDLLNSLCINSSYRGDHGSSPLASGLDFRFVSYLTKDQIIDTGLIKLLSKISPLIGDDIYAGNFYINHYWHYTQSPKHTDSSFDDTVTILIFCNNHWIEEWGGEIKFYSQQEKINSVIDFVPGRVIIFDSRLEHKVLPLTLEAKKPRFSLAIKASKKQGLDSLIKMYGNDNILLLADKK